MGLQEHWSTTADNNDVADSTVNWREGQAPSTVNNSARGVMAQIAKWRKDNSGELVTTGSSTAYVLATNEGFTALANGMVVVARVHTINGATPTLNVDNRGAIPINIAPTSGVGTGTLLTGRIYRFTYVSATPAWVVNTIPETALAAASETTAGIVELATSAETVIGSTDVTRAVTPFGLSQLLLSRTRLKLTASSDRYVRTDGNDNNDGTTDNAAGAWRTVHGALLYIKRNIDLASFTLNVNVRAGSFPPFVAAHPWVGGSYPQIIGAGVTTIFAPTGDNQTVVTADDFAVIGLRNCKLRGTLDVDGVTARSGVVLIDATEAGICDHGFPGTTLELAAASVGVRVGQTGMANGTGPLTVTGDMAALWQIRENGRLGIYSADGAGDVSFVGTPDFTWLFVNTDGGHLMTNGLPVNFAGTVGPATVPYLELRATRADAGTTWPGGAGIPFQNFGHAPPSYAVAQLPNPGLFAGAIVFVSNESGGATIAYSNGLAWRRVYDNAVVS